MTPCLGFSKWSWNAIYCNGKPEGNGIRKMKRESYQHETSRQALGGMHVSFLIITRHPWGDVLSGWTWGKSELKKENVGVTG